MPIVTLEELHSRIGTQVGVSDWITIDQKRIDEFADVTEDRQFIHVDPNAAKETMFGGTVAHGFLSLSLLSRMALDVMLVPDNLKMAVNYGFDRIRFLAPVPVGARVRGIFTLTNVEEKSLGQLLVHHNVMVDIDVTEKPALTADWLSLLIL
ncbi:MAG TPA: MaoC family dehydratase [Sphingomicrobium sp.]|nr:MaoC family dehydratase [Sphingomicrobium sp.]HJS40534.1 MaoC family dehydratase [Sphingomicrobium sp.]